MSALALIALLQLQTSAPLPIPRLISRTVIVMVDGVVNDTHQFTPVRLIQGLDPFVQPSVGTAQQWTFGPETQVGERVGAVFFYRNQNLLPDSPMEFSADCCDDRAASPLRVFDPGYPVNSVGEGTVVMNLRIDAAGRVENVLVVRPEPSLTETAVRAVRQWAFAPAIRGGRVVPSSVVVAIVFQRPVLSNSNPF